MSTDTETLRTKTVALDDLLLDPNNPRFIQDLKAHEHVPDSDVPTVQDSVLARFSTTSTTEVSDDAESSFRIDDLIKSMRAIGFVPIDRVVVRKLDDHEKFLVLEGNRRVAAAKTLIDRDTREKDPEERLSSEMRGSLEQIDVLVLLTDGLSESEIDKRVGVILGLRHYGSVLEWKPLPKAVNIHGEYLATPPRLESFAHDAKRITNVSERLSVSRPEVKNALKTYLAYAQLNEAFPDPLKPHHYSLLSEIVTNRRLEGTEYVERDDITYELSPSSLEKIHHLGQFATRDSLEEDEVILKEPKKVTQFARLITDRDGHELDAVRDRARSLIIEVEQGDSDLDHAVYSLKRFKESKTWVSTLRSLLERSEELPVDDYEPQGNNALHREELEKHFRIIRKILGI